MIACTSTTWDRLAGCEVRCILQAGHEVYHTDGCGMTWSKPSAAPPQPSPYSATEETELQRVTRERDDLRDAARAVVRAFETESPTHCEEDGCTRLATHCVQEGSYYWFKCADHVGTYGAVTVRTYAPAWRRLCALIGANGR